MPTYGRLAPQTPLIIFFLLRRERIKESSAFQGVSRILGTVSYFVYSDGTFISFGYLMSSPSARFVLHHCSAMRTSTHSHLALWKAIHYKILKSLPTE